MVSLVGALHTRLVFNRRTKVLAKQIATLLPKGASILDVGCGDGIIDSLISAQRPDLTFRGVDILIRAKTHIPVEAFDGQHLPAGDKSRDIVLFIDVLHHTVDPVPLLREARRVARKSIIIKDHTRDGPLSYSRLRLMDWVGNAHHNVALPYNYLSESEWRRTFAETGLTIESWQREVGLYLFPASVLFGDGLHCIIVLKPI